MAFLIDAALDAVGSYVSTNGTYIHICSQEPSTYANAATDYTRGNVAITSANWTAADNSTDGRKITLDDDLTITPSSTGSVTHLAVVSGAALLATFDLSATMTVTEDVAVTLPAVAIKTPDYDAA